MIERKKDLLEVKKSIGKTKPEDLGKIFKQYYVKHISKERSDFIVEEAVKAFTGGLL